MDFDDFRQLISGNERLVFIENGKPSFVVVSFEDYKKMAGMNKKENNQGIQLPPYVPAEDIADYPEENTDNFRKDLKLEDLPY